MAYIERLDDNDPKLIVVPNDYQYKKDNILAKIKKDTHFQEKYFKRVIHLF